MFIIECDSSVILNAIVFLFKDPEMRGRRRYFKKPRGKEMLMAVSFSRPQPGLPPRLQPGPGNNYPVRSPGIHGPAPPPAGLAYEHYRPHHPPRPPRGYGPPRLDTKSFTDAYSLFYLLNMSYPYSSEESVFVGFCFIYFFTAWLLVRSSTRFLNRHHLIGPDLAYYPSKRCYQSFDNYSFRSR